MNSFDKTASRIRGIIPALYTPFDRDGNINLKILPKQIEFLSNAGCSGFFVGGSSGEGALQSVRERKMFAEAVIEEVNHRLPVIIHVGAMNPEDSYELAGFSKKMGADAISSIVPYFYNYTVSEVVDYYRKLASAAELPLIVYYMPAIANHNSCLEDFINGILSIPEVIGIKYTDSDLYRLQIIQNITPKSIMLGGYDQMALCFLSMGAQGLIGNTFNFVPEIFVKVYNEFKEGNISVAMAAQKKANQMIYEIRKFGQSTGKMVLKLRGIDLGDYRIPWGKLNKTQTDNLEKKLAEFELL